MTEPDVMPLIRERAYRLWEAKGCPAGQDLDLWLEAEAALTRELQAATPAKPAAGPKRRKGAAEPVTVEAAPAAKPAPRARRPKAAAKA